MDLLIEKNLSVDAGDGIRLSTDVYRPAVESPVPALIMRTPYNKERLSQGDTLRMAQAGYAVVIQDTRGSFASDGTFDPFFQERGDGAATINWVAARPWCSGKIGSIGASYVGATQWLPAAAAPSGLLAMAPFITTADYYESWTYQGGAFQLGFVLSWVLGLATNEQLRRVNAGTTAADAAAPLVDAVDQIQALYAHLPLHDVPLLADLAPYYFEWLKHPTDDAYWRQIAPRQSYERITAPALNIGGWFDGFLRGTIANYRGMKERGGSDMARSRQRLLIGPWSHGNFSGFFAEQAYGGRSSVDGCDLIGTQIRWFDHWLKGIDNGVDRDRPVSIFVMGLNRWRDEIDWPLPDTRFRSFYLHSMGNANSASGSGFLSLDAPIDETEDVYLYDPRRPVPTIGGATLLPGGPIAANAGPRDQRAVQHREDVLSYTSAPLERAIEVTGPIELVLFVSSSARDTDFTGALVDVHPDGTALLLTDGILRARYRESTANPSLLTPGSIYELRIDLGATSMVFAPGHRLRLSVSSSNFPRYDRNSNSGGEIVRQTAADFVQAINRVHHDSAHPSHLLLPCVERD